MFSSCSWICQVNFLQAMNVVGEEAPFLYTLLYSSYLNMHSNTESIQCARFQETGKGCLQKQCTFYRFWADWEQAHLYDWCSSPVHYLSVSVLSTHLSLPSQYVSFRAALQIKPECSNISDNLAWFWFTNMHFSSYPGPPKETHSQIKWNVSKCF